MPSRPTRPPFPASHFLCLLLLLGLTFPAIGSGQEARPVSEDRAHHYTDESWEDLRETLDYSGKAPAPKRSREREASDTPPDRDRDFSLGDGWSMFLKILFFAILGGLLVFLVYTFLKDSERSQNEEPTEEEEAEAALSLEALIEQLDRTELAPYIQEAEASQRYELAIRLQFLAVLKKLNQQGYIRWKKDRTNRVYLQQLYGQPPYAAFRDLSYIFEHYWYGPNRPDAPTYAQLKPRFEQFVVQLQPLSNR